MKKFFLFVLFIPIFVYSQNDTLGVYMCGMSSLKKMVPIKYEKTKINSIGTFLTMGLGNTTSKIIFNKSNSENILSPNGKFVFYYPNKDTNPIELVNILPLSIGGNPNDLCIILLESKKRYRQCLYGTVNILGATFGINGKENSFLIKSISQSKYIVTLNNLPKGEYAFVLKGQNGYGLFLPIFDFAVGN